MKNYIFGHNAALLALQNKKRIIHKVLCTQNVFNQYKNILTQYNTHIVNTQHLNKITKNQVIHQNIIIYTNPIFLQHFNQFHWTQNKDRIIILNNITNSYNVGGIIRSAIAFNINKIIIPKHQSFNKENLIAKTSSGYIEFMQIFITHNLNIIIQKLKKKNFWIIGLDTKGTKIPNTFNKMSKIAIILGSETLGISKNIKQQCNTLIKIQTTTIVNSLNVSCAASILFHYIYQHCT